jgi:hypothetical protein
MANEQQIADPAAAWPLPAVAYKDPNQHSVFVNQRLVIESIGQRLNALEGGTARTNGAAGGGGLAPSISGVVPISQGGTGLSALGAANQLLGANGTDTGLEYKTLQGTANEVAVAFAAGAITLSLPQAIAASSSPAFAGLNLSGMTPSEPVVTDGSKNLASVSYSSFASSLTAAGDVTGALTACTVGALRGVSVPTPSGTNTVLQYSGSALSWATSVNSFTTGTGTKELAYDSGSGAYGLTSGVTFSAAGQLSFAPAAGAEAMVVNMPTSPSSCGPFACYDVSSNLVGLLAWASETPFLEVFSTTAASGGANKAVVQLGCLNYSPAAGDTIAQIVSKSGGSNTGQLFWANAEAGAQSTGHLGTDAVFQLCAVGSGSLTSRFRLRSNGDVELNASGSALATSATSGFSYLPSCAGVPTGTPTARTGELAHVQDSTDNVLFMYNGTTWQDISAGVYVTTATATSTIATTTKWFGLGAGLLTGGSSVVVNLPTAASYLGRELTIVNLGTSSPTRQAILTASGSDTIQKGGSGAASTIAVGLSGAFTNCIRLVSDGSVWRVAGGF